MPSSEQRIRRLVIDWLDDGYHFGEAERLIANDEMSFLKNGILDSLGFVQLILFLEAKLGIKVNRNELNRQNFDSLGRIVSYVSAHRDFRAEALA